MKHQGMERPPESPQGPFEAALARAKGFTLLSECYYPPDHRINAITDELSGCLITLCPEAGPCIEAMKAELKGMKDLTGLAVDYARLFAGPFGVLAPPYASIYLEGEKRVMGDSTLWVQDFYREVNVDISEGIGETPDHVAVELEFMHFLSFKEAEAEARGDREGALHFSRKQEDFLGGHLAAWLWEFTDRIKAHAQTGWYGNLAECTRLFIASRPGGVSTRASEPCRV